MDALLTFANGDTNYIEKHNANGAAIVSAVTAVEEGKQDLSEKGQADGYASLGSDGIVPSSQLPPPAELGDQPYDMMSFYSGLPPNSALLMRARIAREIVLPINLTGSIADAGFAANASTVFTIARNGISIGTITFAGAATVGTFAFVAAVTLAVGDLLTITGPATADVTLADISITLIGTRAP